MQDEREPLYREVADRIVAVDGLTPDEIADRVLRVNGLRRVTVPTRRPAVRRRRRARRGGRARLAAAAVGTARGVRHAGGHPARRSTSHIPHVVFHVGHGEQHKSLATIGDLCRGFAQMGLTRSDVVIGVGGGMVTDVAGFAAASYHRGVPVVHVATSLLGMIDAAIGGKTGVNLPEGKNLVGAFWQPSGVVCELDALDTLPEREVRCGYGEMAKYHFLTGDDLLAMSLTDRIARCVEIKAEVVAADEREDGRRALLNYGHTLAHALEIATEHRLAHGEAVAIGLVFAAHLARVLDRIGDERVDEHYAVVGEEYGLDTDLPAGVERRSPARPDASRQEGARRADVRPRRRATASRSCRASPSRPCSRRSAGWAREARSRAAHEAAAAARGATPTAPRSTPSTAIRR